MIIQYDGDKVPFIDLGNGYKFRLELEEIEDPIYIEKAKEELRETPELTEKSLAEFRMLIKSEVH